MKPFAVVFFLGFAALSLARPQYGGGEGGYGGSLGGYGSLVGGLGSIGGYGGLSGGRGSEGGLSYGGSLGNNLGVKGGSSKGLGDALGPLGDDDGYEGGQGQLGGLSIGIGSLKEIGSLGGYGGISGGISNLGGYGGSSGGQGVSQGGLGSLGGYGGSIGGAEGGQGGEGEGYGGGQRESEPSSYSKKEVHPKHGKSQQSVWLKNSHEKKIEIKAYPKFHYGYQVQDPHTHDIKQQQETRDGSKVKGEYSLVEPDGKHIRIVQYEADKKTGWVAKVIRKKL